jgi:hypothetical protein
MQCALNFNTLECFESALDLNGKQEQPHEPLQTAAVNFGTACTPVRVLAIHGLILFLSLPLSHYCPLFNLCNSILPSRFCAFLELRFTSMWCLTWWLLCTDTLRTIPGFAARCQVDGPTFLCQLMDLDCPAAPHQIHRKMGRVDRCRIPSVF